MAHLTRFFHERKRQEDMQDALSAFRFAETKPSFPRVDLYINRGTILKFLMSYAAAKEDYEKAIKEDPSYKQAKDYLAEMQSQFDLVAQIVERKVSKMAKKAGKTSVKKKEGEKSQEKKEEESIYSAIGQLKGGKNDSCILVGHVVQNVSNRDSTPQVFVCEDSEETRFVVALYDIGGDDIIPTGAELAIQRPLYGAFSLDNKKAYPMIIVEDFTTLTVNGALIPQDARTFAVMSEKK
ncbi:MAG: hypothetical protein EZS28_028789 [Streblomastix strix]|uniref:Tetratricopeptide repeat protein 5 OB fold domain-containing protein n=1 Tax=Streblomastix strix TaxID=222440 RepID=A0A5J4V0X5_9EUKA|nr:MAG: hypothetical protein EZS28_028789 [Streblomastix strix]